MPLRYRRVTYRYTSETLRFPRQDWMPGLRGCLSFPVAPATSWRPSTDVYETATDLVVQMELAGMREEDFEVTLFDDILLVVGHREPDSTPNEALRFFEASIRYGYFQVEVALPLEIDRERVSAQYDRGYLLITMPKLRRSGSRR